MRHNHIHEIAVVNNSGVIGVIAFTVPVTLLRILPSCRTSTMPIVATILRGRSDG
jgi:hypothetical protein